VVYSWWREKDVFVAEEAEAWRPRQDETRENEMTNDLDTHQRGVRHTFRSGGMAAETRRDEMTNQVLIREVGGISSQAHPVGNNENK
jgi:hypothetical protein